MVILSYGYKKPQNTDTGDVFFPAWEDNIQLINDHTHNGVNSAPIAINTISIAHASWVASAIGGGTYEQTVAIPAPFTYDSFLFEFRLSTGERVFPSVTRVSNSSFKIYTNNNALDYVAYLK